jgi:hypothetical protein
LAEGKNQASPLHGDAEPKWFRLPTRLAANSSRCRRHSSASVEEGLIPSNKLVFEQGGPAKMSNVIPQGKQSAAVVVIEIYAKAVACWQELSVSAELVIVDREPQVSVKHP